jgi:hypothetical protein
VSADQKTVRLVISVLGLLAVGVVVGAIVLAYQSKTIPDALISLGSVAVGAVAGILSKTSGSSDEPQAVEVVNRDADPVPVDPQPVKAARKTTKKAGR